MMRLRGIGLLTAVALVALAGSASAQVVGRVDLATVRVTAVPGPPSGDFWDGSIIGGLPGLMGAIVKKTSAPYYPDIEVCVGSRGGCRLVCVNAQLNADDPRLKPACGLQLATGYRVAELVDANGQRQWRLRDVEFEVNEIDEDGSTGNRRHIGRLALYAGANPPILQPDKCTDAEPCTRVVETERGPLAMSFTTTFNEVVAPRPPPNLPGAPDGNNAGNQPPAKPAAPSYYDRVKKWWDDFLWDKAKEPAGFRGTLLEGLAEQAAKARTNYADCLHDFIAEPKNNLASRFELVCAGKSGDALTSCAYQVIAENRPDVAQACLTNEVTYGFLANMWRSACGIVKMSC